MKISTILMIVLIVGLFLLAGCASNDGYKSAPAAPSGQYVGGGCGVAGVPLDAEAVSENPVPANGF